MRGVDRLLLLQCGSAGGTNPFGAYFREVRRHSEFSGIDRMEAAFGGDSDLESTMEFARGIINIRFAPRNNRSTFDTGIWKAFSIQFAKRTHDLRKSVKRSADYPRAERFWRICLPVGGRHMLWRSPASMWDTRSDR